MDCLGGDQLLAQLLGQLLRALDRLDKDDHLVELELVDQVRELLDLLVGGERHVVLLQAVEGQLALVLDQHLSGVAHELAARLLDLRGQRRSVHHHLLVVRGLRKDLLDVLAHAY